VDIATVSQEAFEEATTSLCLVLENLRSAQPDYEEAAEGEGMEQGEVDTEGRAESGDVKRLPTPVEIDTAMDTTPPQGVPPTHASSALGTQSVSQPKRMPRAQGVKKLSVKKNRPVSQPVVLDHSSVVARACAPRDMKRADVEVKRNRPDSQPAVWINKDIAAVSQAEFDDTTSSLCRSLGNLRSAQPDYEKAAEGEGMEHEEVDIDGGVEEGADGVEQLPTSMEVATEGGVKQEDVELLPTPMEIDTTMDTALPQG
jgi:hypothetical protein